MGMVSHANICPHTLDGPTVEHAHAQPLLNHRHNGVVIGDLARHMRRQPVRGKRVKYQALLTLI